MKVKLITIMLAAVFLSACQSSVNRFTQDERGANTYSSTEAGQLSSVVEVASSKVLQGFTKIKTSILTLM